jgi:hypothetical protein
MPLSLNHDAQITIILDTWTSSNDQAYLAIVARYINKDHEIGSGPLFCLTG